MSLFLTQSNDYEKPLLGKLRELRLGIIKPAEPIFDLHAAPKQSDEPHQSEDEKSR